MAIFKNTHGEYFEIPREELKKYLLSDADAKQKLMQEGLAGAELAMDDDVLGQTGSTMHVRTL